MHQGDPRDVVMIGGANGAGKTSWAVRRLHSDLGIREFVNADEIARGLSPLNPDSSAILAGRLMLARLGELLGTGISFAFETTCSGRVHVRFLERCREASYRVHLVYLWLPSAQVAIERVARRVSEGGHRIPDDVVVRRYYSGIRNMRRLYLPLSDTALIYDNSDLAGILVASHRLGEHLVVHDADRWSTIDEMSR